MASNGTYGVSLYNSNPSGLQSSGQGSRSWLNATTSCPKWSDPCNRNGSDCGWRGFGNSGGHCNTGGCGGQAGFGNCNSQGGFGHFGHHSGSGGSCSSGGPGGCSPWNKPRCCPPRWGSGCGN